VVHKNGGGGLTLDSSMLNVQRAFIYENDGANTGNSSVNATSANDLSCTGSSMEMCALALDPALLDPRPRMGLHAYYPVLLHVYSVNQILLDGIWSSDESNSHTDCNAATVSSSLSS
jgi:hypothetical protein